MKRTWAALLLALVLITGLFPASAGAFSDRWGHLTPIADDSALLDVTYGNNTWVAVGKLGAVVTSTDGNAWSPQNAGTYEDLRSVAFGGGRFVAVGKQPLVSTNGTDWQKVKIPSAGTVVSVIYAAGKFTAADNKGQVFDSADGNTWTVAKTFGRPPFDPGPPFQSLAYAGGNYVLVDEAGRDHTFGGRTWSDSVSWGTCSRVVYQGGQFLILCDGFVATGTSDGRRWDRRDAKAYALLLDAVHDGRRYVAVGENGTIVTSPDGIAWTVQDKPRQAPDYYAVEYANSLYVLVGDDGRIWSSRDAKAWELRYSGMTADLAAVAGADNLWVAVGSDGAIMSSPNPWPWRWTRYNSGTGQPLRSVAAGGGLFVAVGAQGTVLTSPDGKTWSTQRSGTDADLQAVAYTADGFAAAGKNATGKAVILTSADGRTWKVQQSDLPGFRALTYGQGLFVAVGAGGLVATSSDGVTWTKAAAPVQADLNAVAFGGGRFLAVGGSAGAGVALTSVDGAAWTKVEGAGQQPLYGVTFGTDRFFVTGAQGTAGYWSAGSALQVTPGSIVGEMRAIAAQASRLIAVGNAGAIRSWALPSGERSTVTASAAKVKVGEELTVTVVVFGDDGRTESGRPVTLHQEPPLAEILTADSTTNWEGRAELKVRGVKAGTVTLTAVADDGTRLGRPVTVTIGTECGQRFADVPASHPSCAAIEQLAQLEVIKGYADGFHPDQGLTRAELATMLVRALKLPQAPGESLPFSDVKGHWAAASGSLQAAVKAKAFSGQPDGTFRPDDPVTRAQLVKVVAAAAKLQPAGLPPYRDITGTDWFAGWVSVARQNKLIGSDATFQVYTGLTFEGDRSATRAEAAALLANLLGNK